MVDSQRTVPVDLESNAYQIHIGTGILADSGSRILAAVPSLTHAVLVVDANVRSYAETVAASLRGSGVKTDLLEVAAGEASKSIEVANDLWQQLLEIGADRKTMVIAVGGGVVGDLTGFLAATFTRGLPFCQVPTTLLAHVDSSVGGKTGINLPNAKNMVGCFWQPKLVVIDTETLLSLPPREYYSGLAEVIKYGVIMDADFFAELEACVTQLHDRDPATLQEVIARCCRLKAEVVKADEREVSGRRAILNYGHTYAHAIEAVSGYGQLLHGEAVSIGMICASRLAQQLGRITEDVTSRQVALLNALNLPTQLPTLPHDQLWQAMSRDKKVEHGKLRFVLPDRLGNVQLVADVTEQQVLSSLEASS